jgi:quercetin dioxygenase-like cupin family protein
MKQVFLAATALAAVLGGPASAQEIHKVLKPDAIKWGASPRLPKGAQVAVIYGDPRKEGHYIILAKFPDGYSVPAHWHSQPENVIVISGTFNVGMGNKLDKTKGEAIGPGGFFSSGAKMNHYAWATGDTLIQVTGMGPFDVTCVDPKDDPSAGN